MTTFTNISNRQFKQAAQEFFLATNNVNQADLDSADNGYKCLSLMLIGRSDDWTERELDEAVITMEMAHNRLHEIELADYRQAACA